MTKKERRLFTLSQRTGRPKAENPKSVRYSIRLDNSTEEKLLKYCEEHKLTRGEAIRIAIDKLLEQK